MAKHIDYYFTPVSPWAFLGHARFMQLLRDSGASVSVRPVDFGAVFPAGGMLLLARRALQVPPNPNQSSSQCPQTRLRC